MCTTFHLHEFRTHVLSRAVMLCAAILSMIFIMVGHVSVLARYNPVLAGLNHTAQLYFELWRLEYVVDDKEKIHQTYSGGQQVSITVPRIFLSVGLCCSFCTVIVSAVLLVVRFSQQQQMNMDCTIAAFSEMVNSNALGPSVRTMRRRASLEMAYLQARDQHRYAVDRLWGILLVCVSSFTVLAVVIFLATFRVFYSSNITTLNSTEKRSHLCAGYWLVCVSVVLLVFVGATSVVTPLTGTYIIKWLGEPPALTREGIRENGQQQQSRSASSWWVSGDTPFATAAASAPPPVVGDEDALSPATGGANRKRSRARWAYVSVPVIEDGSSMPVHHLRPVTGVELDEP